MKKREKVIVSACLLGQCCRYDGATKEDPELSLCLKDKDVVAFCPEDVAFGTPRPRIKVVKTSADYRLLREEDGKDVTQFVVDATEAIMAIHPNADYLILKSKSPSCGCGTTPIFNKDGMQIAFEDGMATMTFKKSFTKIYDETNYKEAIC